MRQAHSHEWQRRASGLVRGLPSWRARRSRRSTLAGALAGASALLTLLIASSAAHGATRDMSATHAYIRANYALARVAVARIPISEARIQDFNRKLAAQCPQAGRGTTWWRHVSNIASKLCRRRPKEQCQGQGHSG